MRTGSTCLTFIMVLESLEAESAVFVLDAQDERRLPG